MVLQPHKDGRMHNTQVTDFLDRVDAGEKRQPILNVSWQTIHDAIDTLACWIEQIKPTLIVGVSRGGLIPATLLSHKLNIPLSVVSCSAYEGTRRTLQKPIVVEGWKKAFDSVRTLVVDDILDSGETLEALRYKTGDGYSGNFHFASLFTKNPTLNNRNIYFAQVPKDVWVKFPWEGDES